MFSYIVGTIAYKRENLLVLECANIGYEMIVSLNTYENLPEINEEIKIYTYLQVRDDGLSLYGFESMEEKEMFLKLITVTGVGPKAAISVLSGIKLNKLASAIINEDLVLLSSTKGVGKKTAERIVLELKDKLDMTNILVSKEEQAAITPAVEEAAMVLVSLGINKNEALKTARLCAKENSQAEEIIAVALRRLNS